MTQIYDWLLAAEQIVSGLCDAFVSLRVRLQTVKYMYRRSGTHLPENVLVYLFLLLEAVTKSFNTAKMNPGFKLLRQDGRDRIARFVVRAIHDDSIDVDRVRTVMLKLESLLLPSVNFVSILHFIFTFYELQFNIDLVVDSSSHKLLDTLMKEKRLWWKVIEGFIAGERSISITCYDPYLNRPSECVCLVQFLYYLRERFGLTYHAVDFVKIIRSYRLPKRDFGKEALFTSSAVKKAFLETITSRLLHIKPNVLPQGLQSDWKAPVVSLSNSNFELRISASEGFAFWWNNRYLGKTPTAMEQELNPLLDMDMFNMAIKNPGEIRYTITLTPNNKRELVN